MITMTRKEAAILRLLQTNGEMDGLRMVYAAPETLKRVYIYQTLAAMEEKGWIVAEIKIPNDAYTPARRHYSITPQGAVIHADGVIAKMEDEA